jgi:hypothetical protein
MIIRETENESSMYKTGNVSRHASGCLQFYPAEIMFNRQDLSTEFFINFFVSKYIHFNLPKLDKSKNTMTG